MAKSGNEIYLEIKNEIVMEQIHTQFLIRIVKHKTIVYNNFLCSLMAICECATS